MTVEIASVVCGGEGPKLPTTQQVTIFDNTANLFTPCQAYQALLEKTESDILIYLHDDVELYDPQWLDRVLHLFENPDCVVVGLGGATSLGRPELYKRKYRIQDMARGGYASNQRDAETHGERFTGDRRVAVLDAFFQAARVDWLRGIGGWPVEHLSHHCADLWLGCMAARTECEVWMAGVDCLHKGGGSSTKPAYREAKWLQGGTLESDHQEPHVWLMREFSDVLPISI